MKQYQVDRIGIHDILWQTLEKLGISIQDVAETTRLPAAILLNQNHATTDQYFQVWESFARISANPDIGIEFAKAVDITQLPPSFFAAHIARNYRDALHRVARFKRLSVPESILIEEDQEKCRIEIEWVTTDKSMPDTLVDATFASLLELGRRNTKSDISAKSVSLTRAPHNSNYLEAYFACDVRYNAQCNALTLDRNLLDSPFTSYNQELLNMVVPQLEHELDSALYKDLYSNQVKWVIGQCLSSGSPKIALVAKELGVGVRTLQRRITAEGYTFKELLNQVRFESAKSYLSNQELSLFEIATLLGYEDQNSFYRAFKAWEGDSPSGWRERHQSFRN